MLRRIVPAEGWLADHPRVVLGVRATLYLGAAATLGTLAVATFGFLGVLAAFAGLAAVVDATLPGAVSLGLGGLGVALSLTVGALVVAGVRRLDARVVAAAERPDPLERLRDRYVNADIDEAEFERRLERLLDGREAGDAESKSESSRTPAAPEFEFEFERT